MRNVSVQMVCRVEDSREPVMRSYEKDFREGLERWIEQTIRLAFQSLPHPCEKRVNRLRQRIEELRARLDRLARKIDEKQGQPQKKPAPEEEPPPCREEQLKSAL